MLRRFLGKISSDGKLFSSDQNSFSSDGNERSRNGLFPFEASGARKVAGREREFVWFQFFDVGVELLSDAEVAFGSGCHCEREACGSWLIAVGEGEFPCECAAGFGVGFDSVRIDVVRLAGVVARAVGSQSKSDGCAFAEVEVLARNADVPGRAYGRSPCAGNGGFPLRSRERRSGVMAVGTAARKSRDDGQQKRCDESMRDEFFHDGRFFWGCLELMILILQI